MWSTTQKNATSAWFEPNHFVPLLPRLSEFTIPTCELDCVKNLKPTANLKSFQCKMQEFSPLQLTINAFQKYRPELETKSKGHQQSNLINLTITRQKFLLGSQVNTSRHSEEGTKRCFSVAVEVLSQSEYGSKQLAAVGTLQDIQTLLFPS